MQRCIEIVTCQGILINIAGIIMAGSFTPHLTEDSSCLQRKMRNYLPNLTGTQIDILGLIQWLCYECAMCGQSYNQRQKFLLISIIQCFGVSSHSSSSLWNQIILMIKIMNAVHIIIRDCSDLSKFTSSIKYSPPHNGLQSKINAVFYLLFAIVYQCLGKLYINKRYCCVIKIQC